MSIEPSPESAPELAKASPRPCRCCRLDLQGWIQVYDHISLPAGAKLQLPQQWGVWFIAASVALVAVVAEGFCEAVAQLATGSRLRAANEAAEERNRAAAAREQAARRARIQDGCLAAQCRFLLADTSRNRLQLSESLAVLLDELRPPEA